MIQALKAGIVERAYKGITVLSSSILAMLVAAGLNGTPINQTAHSQLNCPFVPGLQEFVSDAIQEKIFFIVGERHGTNEYPAFFGDLVCNIVNSRPVVVSLEFPISSTASMREYLDSDGSASARAKLLSGNAWDTRYADGRSSEAMFQLLERLRRMKQLGARLMLYCSQPDVKTLQPQYYNELYRANVWSDDAAQNPGALNMILVGNAHAALIYDKNGFLPAAAHLRRDDVVSISPTREGGTSFSLDVDASGRTSTGTFPLPAGTPAQRGIAPNQRSLPRYDALYAVGAAPTTSFPAASRPDVGP